MCIVFYALREYLTGSTTCSRAVFAQNLSATAEKSYPQARKPCAAKVLGLLSLSSKYATSAPRGHYHGVESRQHLPAHPQHRHRALPGGRTSSARHQGGCRPSSSICHPVSAELTCLVGLCGGTYIKLKNF
jgi:hypothetical protein